MVHSNVQISRSEQGYTLMEILIALLIAGILATFSLPSLLSLLESNEVKSAQDQVQNALRDAQRQAIRRSQTCEIILDENANPPQVRTDGTTDNEGCLTSTQILPSSVAMNTNLSGDPPKIQYNFKGHTNKLGTIVLYPDNWNTNQSTTSVRCIVISETLGIMRSGVYRENPTGTISADHCNTSTSTL